MAEPHTTTSLPRKKLTEAGIARLKPPLSGRLQIPDGHLTGLWLRVTDRGVKSWSVLYRANGGPVRRLTLGRWPAVGVAEARGLAQKALLTAAKGRDPALLKREQQEQSADRFEAVAAEFVERRCRLRKLRTAGEIEVMIGKYLLPAWSGRRISTITKHDVLKVVDAIADRGHGRQANKVLGLVKQMFSWAEQRGLVERNVAAGIPKPHAEKSRDRVLSDAELAAVWRAVEPMGWPWCPFIRLLTLLGQRRSEVATMRWQDLDLDAGLWRMPGELTKMGRSRELPLPGAAVKLLKALPRVDGPGGFVFPSGRLGSARAVSGFSKAKRRLDAEMLGLLQKEAADLGGDPTKVNLDPWRLHDLRRSVATGLQRLGVRLEVTEAVLGHVSGSRAGVVGVYQRHQYLPEQRVALERWAQHVARLIGGEGAKVVKLGSRG